MLDKLKQEIKSTLKEEEGSYKKLYNERTDEGNGIHKGWIEALEYVMGQIDHFSKEEELNEFTGFCPKCGSDENIEASNGTSWGEYDYDCLDCGHSFTIESKGWEVTNG